VRSPSRFGRIVCGLRLAALVGAMVKLHRWGTLDAAVKADATGNLGVTPDEFEQLLTDEVMLAVMDMLGPDAS